MRPKEGKQENIPNKYLSPGPNRVGVFREYPVMLFDADPANKFKLLLLLLLLLAA